jgi:hypothetical protein
LQVFGVVGHGDERADVVAGRAPGDKEGFRRTGVQVKDLLCSHGGTRELKESGSRPF